MANRSFFTLVNRAFNADGTFAPGAKAYFYVNNTTTQLPVYSDAEATVVIGQPVVADGNGVMAPIYMATSDSYRALLKDADDTTLPGYPMDDIVPITTTPTNAASVSFSPTEDLPYTTVQDAIEGAAELSTDQTAIIRRSLTAWVTGGSSNAFTITPSPVLTSYGAWQAFLVRLNRANTGASTLNINTLGARNWRKYNAAGAAVALVEGDLAAGMTVMVYYDGTQFVTLLGSSIESTIIGANVAAAATFTGVTLTGNNITRDEADGFLRVSGGDEAQDGAFTNWYGSTHATLANYAIRYADHHIFNTKAGGEIGRFRTTGGTDGLFVGSATHIDPGVAEYGVTMLPAGALHIKRSAGHPVNIGRSNDGSLVSFQSGTTTEGTISVSASTVTYGAFCGAHWAQLSGLTMPDILPGTIFETIDEMCEWPGEENLTLPKVREAREESTCVYGVFSHWDFKTDAKGADVLDAKGQRIRTPDFHVASLGAKFVRISPGEKVKNGDLIECDGKGMGRAQADGVFRSSTVAKVTSGLAVETYWDGSYLVPCTLHCG